MALQQLSRVDVAERLGFTSPKTVDKYRERGIMPEPDGYVGRAPWWHARTIDEWDADRRKMPKRDEQQTATS